MDNTPMSDMTHSTPQHMEGALLMFAVMLGALLAFAAVLGIVRARQGKLSIGRFEGIVGWVVFLTILGLVIEEIITYVLLPRLPVGITAWLGGEGEHALFHFPAAVVVLLTTFQVRRLPRAAVTEGVLGDDIELATVAPMIKLVRLVILLVGIALAFQTLGADLLGVFAALGIGGLVVGLASQATVANFIGFLTIVGTKPFKRGDTIGLHAGGDVPVSGKVLEIGILTTRIKGKSTTVQIPNSHFTQGIINKVLPTPEPTPVEEKPDAPAVKRTAAARTIRR